MAQEKSSKERFTIERKTSYELGWLSCPPVTGCGLLYKIHAKYRDNRQLALGLVDQMVALLEGRSTTPQSRKYTPGLSAGKCWEVMVRHEIEMIMLSMAK